MIPTTEQRRAPEDVPGHRRCDTEVLEQDTATT